MTFFLPKRLFPQGPATSFYRQTEGLFLSHPPLSFLGNLMLVTPLHQGLLLLNLRLSPALLLFEAL